ALVLGYPAQQLGTIGVTGTNGKTSVTMMLTQLLHALGRPAGVVGTSGTEYRAADGTEHRIATVRTTPEAPELHGLLARMVEDGVAFAAIEFSSLAPAPPRASEAALDVACFALSPPDPLHLHGTMPPFYRSNRALLTPDHS